MCWPAPSGASASKEMIVGLAARLGAVEVGDVVDQAQVVLEDSLEPTRVGALDGVGPGLVDLGGHGVVLDGVDQVTRGRALVADHDLEALVEEGVLAHPVGEGLQVVRRGLEDLLRGPPGHGRAGALAVLHGADLLERRVRVAELEALPPQVTTVLDLDDETGRQRVDDRDTDAVQAAGHLVAAAAELAAGVQQRQRHRHRGQLLAGRGVGRDAAAVVDDLDAAVGPQREHDAVAVAGQRLVDRVVDDLGDQVVQAALTGRADVHARPLADGLETLEHGDGGGVVVAVDIGGDGDRVGEDGGRDVGSPITCRGRLRRWFPRSRAPSSTRPLHTAVHMPVRMTGVAAGEHATRCP